MNVRLNRNATVHLAVTVGEGDDVRVIGRACNAWESATPGRRLRVEVTTDAVTCKSCKRIADKPEPVAEPVDETCADCLGNARPSAVENWRDANGHEPATAAELAEVEREARGYVAEGMTTPCEAHKPIDPRSLPYRNGYPVVGCVDCLTHAASSADENWCDDKGRAPETDAELAEVDAWARSYVAEGMTTACALHAEPPREVGVVVGTVACFDCDETHEASYSHEGSHGEGAVYAVVCGDFIEHYTAEAVDFGKRLEPPATVTIADAVPSTVEVEDRQRRFVERYSRELGRHDYERGDDAPRMRTDSSCAVCGQAKRSPWHVGE